MGKVNFFWFRRDLRFHDNHGLYEALMAGKPVIAVFVFDINILEKLNDRSDARVTFIYQTLARIQEELRTLGSDLLIIKDTPENAWKTWLKTYNADTIFCNRDYEPYARERDDLVARIAGAGGVNFRSYKDQVIFEQGEVVKDDNTPYTVYTPYAKKWKSHFNVKMLGNYDVPPKAQNWFQFRSSDLPSLKELGFNESGIKVSDPRVEKNFLSEYEQQRDFPAVDGTSRVSVHLRFGTVSIRQLFKIGFAASEKWVNELIWREFYMQILACFPKVVNASFKSGYDHIEWRNNEAEFSAWCHGETGYPIVDAGMRELNATGFMHNRVRMIVASFLTKHLLIDWRWGEAYFAEKLLDYELASNNGGWQWAAGCGVDAAPYFRIFNPAIQTKKFDPQWRYIRKWVPEVDSLTYARPIVEHEFARKRCLEVYKRALVPG